MYNRLVWKQNDLLLRNWLPVKLLQFPQFLRMCYRYVKRTRLKYYQVIFMIYSVVKHFVPPLLFYKPLHIFSLLRFKKWIANIELLALHILTVLIMVTDNTSAWHLKNSVLYYNKLLKHLISHCTKPPLNLMTFTFAPGCLD